MANTEPCCNEAARLARPKEVRYVAVLEDQELAIGALAPPDALQSTLERMDQAHAGRGDGAATLDGQVGPSCDTAAQLETLQVSSAALDALVRADDVLEVMSSDGFPLCPAFQFGQDAQPLPGCMKCSLSSTRNRLTHRATRCG
ncbi:hypothetical protein [Frigoribacterium sp. PvP054]|uniref:hypothetical protein n=1 Tax=Frigoribacterium sp. PvP054 TaxID=3156438 RepID=UPI003392E11B